MSGLEPLMFVAAIASVAGGVMGYQSSRYQMDVAEQNAEAAKKEGSAAAAIEAAEGRRQVGRATALAAASGLTVDGSAADVIGSMAATADFNARSAIHHGRRRVQQANADRIYARNQGNAALLSGVSQGASLLTYGLGGSKGDGAAAAGATG